VGSSFDPEIVKNCHFLSNFVKYCINLQMIQTLFQQNNPFHKEKNANLIILYFNYSLLFIA